MGRILITCAAGLTLLASIGAAESQPVVDRGLPQANLNSGAGASRSNIRWSWYGNGFIGDDFAIGAAGENWVIDSIRVWAVPGSQTQMKEHFGDYFQDVRLYLGGAERELTPVAAAQLKQGSDEASSPDVRISEASLPGSVLYDDGAAFLRLWQIDFNNLNIAVRGGATYRFGSWGAGRAIPDRDGKTYAFFVHASNGALGGTQSGDGKMLLFDLGGRAKGDLNGDGAGWDKSSDVNVQVFAHRIGDDAAGLSRIE